MRRRVPALLAALVAALALTGSAVAFDCIRVSSSLQGLVQSTSKSGNWLLFDFSSAEGVQNTFANVFEVEITGEQAACLATEYAKSEQPKYFALGIGVAGGKKQSLPESSPRGEGFGVIAWHNPNDEVLGNGKGIDHIEDGGILPAVFAAGAACGLEIPEE
jgi:hypothetical protein